MCTTYSSWRHPMAPNRYAARIICICILNERCEHHAAHTAYTRQIVMEWARNEMAQTHHQRSIHTYAPCALQLIRLTLTTISVAFLRNTWPVTSSTGLYLRPSQRNTHDKRKPRIHNILVVVCAVQLSNFSPSLLFFSSLVRFRFMCVLSMI